MNRTFFSLRTNRHFTVAFWVFSVLMFAFALRATAQWTTSGSHIYNQNSGNVGIGTQTPGSKLDIQGDVGSSGLRIQGAYPYGTYYLDFTPFLRNTPWSVGYNLTLKNLGGLYSNFMTLIDGNVGIGTTVPSQKLEVNGNILQNGENAGFGVDAQANPRLGIVKKHGYYPVIASDNGSPIIFAQSNQTGLFTSISTAMLSERMRIDVNGNVGVGTTAPISKLHIADGDGGEQLRFSRGTGTVRFAQEINRDNLYLYNNNASLVYMTWRENGNVGIGTENPDSKLTVKGAIHAQEVRVDLNGAVAPDYVFEKDYKLMPLDELKVYLKANKHLPEVPSAKEMEKNGVQLGEMNMLLLKKIEELTLHLIEQNKIISKLNEKVSNLENKN